MVVKVIEPVVFLTEEQHTNLKSEMADIIQTILQSETATVATHKLARINMQYFHAYIQDGGVKIAQISPSSGGSYKVIMST